jgi:hypothetical protein
MQGGRLVGVLSERDLAAEPAPMFANAVKSRI